MVPSSKIYICAGVLLRSDQAHTIYFANETAQRNYFIGRAAANVGGRTFTDYTFTRDNIAYVEASLQTAEYWNYAMIENTVEAGPVMRKYYFIEDVEYIDENTVGLHLKLDVMQTFQHQPGGGYNAFLPSCFVEREHSVYDGSRAFNGITYNTEDEPVNVGDYINRVDDYPFKTNGGWGMICASTINLYDLEQGSTQSDVHKVYGFPLNGIYSGLTYSLMRIENNASGISLIKDLSNWGYAEAINDMYMFPLDYVTETGSSVLHPFGRITGSNTLTKSYNKPTQIGSYTPRNKKLLQYPFCFGYLTNNTGLSATYQFERYQQYDANDAGKFTLKLNVNPTSDACVMAYPLGRYKGSLPNLEESVTTNNFPRIPWVTDQYKLWLAQTANTRQYTYDVAKFQHTLGEEQYYNKSFQNGLNLLGGAIEAVATGGMLGAGSITGAIGSQMDLELGQWANDRTYQLAKQSISAGIRDRSIQPPTAHGTAQGLMGYINNSLFMKFQVKTVDDMHARIIDEFFDHYGYATNTFKVPNISSRPSWNFVKTAGFDVKLAIPQRYKVAISEVFNNGITFWKNPAKIGDYTQNNAAQS